MKRDKRARLREDDNLAQEGGAMDDHARGRDGAAPGTRQLTRESDDEGARCARGRISIVWFGLEQKTYVCITLSVRPAEKIYVHAWCKGARTTVSM